MPRDYRPMLDPAEELESYSGYRGPPQQKEVMRLRGAFDQKRREFVYGLIREGGEPSLIWPSVASDLKRIDASGETYDDALHFVREELQKHIAKQVGNHPVLRFVTRWALPVGGAIAAIAYVYVKFLAINP